MTASNLPAKIDTIRQLFERPAIKQQLAAALPKHLSVDRLLRVAMTAIRTNPKLADCTQKSLLACMMGSAALGLECEPFLGQAYLVPFKRGESLECTLIPGYRGYIALARRSGEVQSVSAQVVYENDRFSLQYGLNETLDHVPADGDRGKPKGAYVVFRYKDGSHSFDYMSHPDIEKIRARSKAATNGPWVTDWDEMAKKTVIRRHVKLAPLSVEMAHAAALEERANIGESQIDLLTGEVEATEGEVVEESGPPPDFATIAKAHTKGDTHKEAALLIFLTRNADYQKATVEDVKKAAMDNQENFWKSFDAWYSKQAKTEQKQGKQTAKSEKTGEHTAPPPEEGRSTPPEAHSGPVTLKDASEMPQKVSCPETHSYQEKDFCLDSCISRADCREWVKVEG